MSTKSFISHNANETQSIATTFAKEILEQQQSNQAVVLCLKGNLGAGKTTFLQGFAKGLGITEKVLSPTFIVMRRFALKSKKFKNFYHLDCYRLNSGADVEVLGFNEIISNPENIVAIEWPEKIQEALPSKSVTIELKDYEKEIREISIYE